MRKRTVSALMMTLLLFAGCGERAAGPEEIFTAFREELTSAESLTAEVKLTADRGGTTEEYVLRVTSRGGETEVTVTEPEMLAGITAAVKEGETSLAYDGVMLGAGPADAEGTTPMSAAPVILRAMAEGYGELFWRDGSLAAARFYAGEDTRCTVWLEPESRTPTAAEISSDGRAVIVCRFTDWNLE